MILVLEKLISVRERIKLASEKAGRDPSSVSLIAVTKTVGAESINEAISAGVSVIGENRIQEARDKFPSLKPCSRHLIGNLQKNKVKYVFGLFQMVQSVHSIDLAAEIDRRAANRESTMDILVQVNIGIEDSKYGVLPEDVVNLFRKLASLKNVACRGLMCIPPFSADPEESRPFFRKMVALKTEIEAKVSLNYPLSELSMGMSNDFEVAIEEGATIIRVGRAIFGGRS